MRKGISKDPSKTAIIVYPKKDHNGAFDVYPVVDKLLALGYSVQYYEADSEEKAKTYLDEATINGEAPVDLVWLGGHGSEKTLSLGGADISFVLVVNGEEMADHELTKNEGAYIDTGDFSNGNPDIDFGKYTKKDFVVDSCSTAEGGEENPQNLANTMARSLPPHIKLHGSTKPMNVKNIVIDDNGDLVVTWTRDSYYTVHGKKSE